MNDLAELVSLLLTILSELRHGIVSIINDIVCWLSDFCARFGGVHACLFYILLAITISLLWFIYIYHVSFRIPKTGNLRQVLYPKYTEAQKLAHRYRAASVHMRFMYLNAQFVKDCAGIGGDRVLYFSELHDKPQLPDLRKDFIHPGDSIVVNVPRFSNHSHPVAAAYRTCVRDYMTGLALRAGRDPFHVSGAQNDVGNASHMFYTAKDFAQAYRDDHITEDSVLLFNDVDYYADMPTYMNLFLPMLLYTLSPRKLSGRLNDHFYRIINDEVEMLVAGGARYRHRLWNYQVETLTQVHPVTGELLVYSVERRCIQGDDDHEIVFIMPVARVEELAWRCLAVKHEPLRRRVFSNQLYDPIADVLSVASADGYHSVEIPGSVAAAIVALQEQCSGPLKAGSIERILSIAKIDNPSSKAPLLVGLTNLQHNFQVIPTGQFPTSYMPCGSLVHDEGQKVGQAVTTPLVSEPALFPKRSISSDEATISGRINKPRNMITPPHRYTRYAHEFLNRLVPKRGLGYAWSYDQVAEHQDKPRQRARREASALTLSDYAPGKLRSFMKVEPYASVNDPRNITTIAPETTTTMSSFTYPFKYDVLSRFDFYAPGMDPHVQAARVMTLAQSACVGTDFSRFDGSISKWLQETIVLAAYARYLPPALRPIFEQNFRAVFVPKATTSHNLPYNPGYGTRSGSPITTDGNTMINAFVYFCAGRQIGESCAEAFSRLGLLCGDDGLSSDRLGFVEAMERVTSDLGLKAEVVAYPLDSSVTFCGRTFVHPRTHPDSHQDILRTIAKLHLTSNTDVSREQAAYNRAIGYLTTDSMTPVISDYCRAILRITGINSVSKLTHEEEYKCSMAWPQYDADAIRASVCTQLGVYEHELDGMVAAIAGATSLDDIPVILDTRREVKIDAMVGNEIHYAGSHIVNQNGGDKQQNNNANSGTDLQLIRSVGGSENATDGRTYGEAAIARPSRTDAQNRSTFGRSTSQGGRSPGAGDDKAADPSNGRVSKRTSTKRNRCKVRRERTSARGEG